jgi:hypothetical protein
LYIARLLDSLLFVIARLDPLFAVLVGRRAAEVCQRVRRESIENERDYGKSVVKVTQVIHSF